MRLRLARGPAPKLRYFLQYSSASGCFGRVQLASALGVTVDVLADRNQFHGLLDEEEFASTPRIGCTCSGGWPVPMRMICKFIFESWDNRR